MLVEMVKEFMNSKELPLHHNEPTAAILAWIMLMHSKEPAQSLSSRQNILQSKIQTRLWTSEEMSKGDKCSVWKPVGVSTGDKTAIWNKPTTR